MTTIPAATGQEPTATTEGLEPTAPITTAETTTETPKPTGLDALSADELKKMVKDLRSESASHRTKLSAYEKAEEERKQAAMTELEKAQQAATVASEARAALEAKLAKRDAISALKGANVVDPDLAFLAIKDQITMSDGEPVNIDDLVKEFVAARPQMVAAATPVVPDIRSTNPSALSETAPRGRPAGRL